MKKMMIGTMMLSLLALGFAGTAQAEETEVTYNEPNNYVLVIPTSINIKEEKEIEIGTAWHNIAPGEQLTISLSDTNEAIDNEGTISLKRERDIPASHTLSTKLTKDSGSTILKKGDLLVKATGKVDDRNVTKFKFADLEGEKKAGQYKATINFVADVGQGM